MNIDDDILQDFLIEAGELFEMLGEQIVELEQNPEDSELLNAIFRAFHTIKGGAGFLKITPMVETCHRAEDVFNVLRQGERIADANLIDVILQVIDVLGDMFDLLRGGEELPDADPQLLRSLEKLLSENAGAEAESEPAAVVAETEAASVEPATVEQNSSEPAGGEAADMDTEFEAMLQAAQQPEPANEKKDDDIISDDEFENLLDELHGAGKHSGVPVAADAAGEKPSPAGSDELITDDEFENLLDELHGAGKHGGVPGGENAAAEATVAATTEKAGSDDLISDDEFEAVLDDMYGKNRGPGSASEGKAKNTGAAEPVKSPAQDAASPPVPDAVSDAAAAEPAGTRAVSDTPVSPPPVSTPPASSVGVDRTAGAAKKTPAKRKAAGAQAETSVRVDTSRLDDIMNLVGELVLVRNRLSTLKQIVREGQVLDAISNLELVTSDLQASVMKTRMQPIKKVFNRFPRVIRDLARQLNKDIELVLVGEDTDLDKNLVEALADPLVHLVRNAVDHGIESPEERFANGKPRQGTVTLSAVQEGDQILLTISDDGKGMDHEMLRRKAVEKELMSEEAANRLTETEAYNLIFAPGFSTKTEISDVSGRGVGMDVVKTRIAELNGTLEINSSPGKGSIITIRLPLTLAILPTLMVDIANHQFALPLTNVNEAFNMQPDHINIVDGQEVMRVRDKPLPLYYLHSWLVHDSTFGGPQASHKVIVVQMGSQQFCLVVDHLIGQEEVVIKPLGRMISDTPGFAGATITGDGSIALVLDMPSLVKRYAAAY